MIIMQISMTSGTVALYYCTMCIISIILELFIEHIEALEACFRFLHVM